LFAGSFEGARPAALLYSLVQSCALVDVPPFEYLKDVLLRVATHHRNLAFLKYSRHARRNSSREECDAETTQNPNLPCFYIAARVREDSAHSRKQAVIDYSRMDRSESG
jgi:hypothetical protein